MKTWMMIVGLACFQLAGCSLLSEPPPFPQIDSLDGGPKEEGPTHHDFGQPSHDAFMNMRPRPRPRPDARLDVGQPDMGASDTGVSQDGAVTDMMIPDQGGTTEPGVCVQRCMDNSECADDRTCHQGRCVSTACVEPDLCMSNLSRWRDTCEDDGGCVGDWLCVRVGIIGQCALGVITSEDGTATNCDGLGLSPMERERPDGALVNVCGEARAACRDGICGLGCTDDTDCSDSEHPACDAESGRCLCSGDSCNRSGSICGDTGRCRCTSDEECSQVDPSTGNRFVCEPPR